MDKSCVPNWEKADFYLFSMINQILKASVVVRVRVSLQEINLRLCNVHKSDLSKQMCGCVCGSTGVGLNQWEHGDIFSRPSLSEVCVCVLKFLKPNFLKSL